MLEIQSSYLMREWLKASKVWVYNYSLFCSVFGRVRYLVSKSVRHYFLLCRGVLNKEISYCYLLFKLIKFILEILLFISFVQDWILNYNYRVSRKTVSALFTVIFWLLLHLGLKCWTFSWSPFNSDFKTVLILIPSIKIDQMSTLRRKKRYLETNIFLNKTTS